MVIIDKLTTYKKNRINIILHPMIKFLSSFGILLLLFYFLLIIIKSIDLDIKALFISSKMKKLK
jgi:hypothetical protein